MVAALYADVWERERLFHIHKPGIISGSSWASVPDVATAWKHAAASDVKRRGRVIDPLTHIISAGTQRIQSGVSDSRMLPMSIVDILSDVGGLSSTSQPQKLLHSVTLPRLIGDMPRRLAAVTSVRSSGRREAT